MALPYATENQLKLLEQKTKSELDKKTENVNLTADTLEDMNALITKGRVTDGQICYCKADKKLYVLKDNTWSEVGGGGIPVVEGTFSETTEEGAQFTVNIPQAQSDVFILSLPDIASYFIIGSFAGEYIGNFIAKNDGNPDELIINYFSGRDTTISLYGKSLLNGGDGGGGNIVTIEVTSMPDTQTTIDVSAITNDTQFVNIKETSTNKNYLLYRVGNDFASCFSNEFTQGKIVAYYYINTQQKQLYYFISSVGKIGKIFGNHDIQVPAVSSDNILPCTAADNGKVLSVVNGEAQWASGGGELSGDALMNATKDSKTIKRTLDTDGKVTFATNKPITIAQSYNGNVSMNVPLSTITDSAHVVKANTNIIISTYNSTADGVFYLDYNISEADHVNKFFIGFENYSGSVENIGKSIPVSLPVAWLVGGNGDGSRGVNLQVGMTVLQDTDISDIAAKGDNANIYVYAYNWLFNKYHKVGATYTYIKVN